MTLEPKEAIKRLLDGATNIEARRKGSQKANDWHSVTLGWSAGWFLSTLLNYFEYRTIETEEASC